MFNYGWLKITEIETISVSVADDTYPSAALLHPTGVRLPEVLVRHLCYTHASFGHVDSRPGQIEIESDLFPADRVLKGGVNNVTKLGVRVLPGDVQNNRGQGAKFILKSQGQFCETFENLIY